MNIYVGNLAFDCTDEDLRSAFEAYGDVASAKVIRDRESGQSRGFGFVEMPADDQGRKAVEGLNGQDHMGRELRVNEARPKEEGGGRGGGGYQRHH